MGASVLQMCLIYKRPIDFLLPKVTGGNRENMALQSQDLHFFFSSHCYDTKCNIWKYIRRTEESLLELHLILFILHKAADGSVCLPKN